MDPLSLTASVVAIMQLTSTLASYISETRNATAEQAKVAVEASNLYGLLTALRFRVEAAQSDDLWFNQVKLLGMKNGPLDQFKEILETMVEKLPSTRRRDQIRSAMSWKYTKKEVNDALARMERLKSLISCALTEDLAALSRAIHEDTAAVREQVEQLHERIEGLQIRMDQQLSNTLSQWLGIPDSSTNYHAALGKRHPATGKWLLEGQTFAEWKRPGSSLIWLHGNAGCGKTILSAASLQNIFKHKESYPNTIVSYFYFDFNDAGKQSSNKAIRSLLFQFAGQVDEIAEDLQRLYQKCGNGAHQPAEDVIRLMLKEAVALSGEKYTIIDALDECIDREVLLHFLGEVVASKPPGLHILATSRRLKDIEDGLGPIANHVVHIQSAVVDEDIRTYVRYQMSTDKRLQKWPEPVQDEIATTIMEKADGMFRWVFCQLQSIRQCIQLKALRKTLSSLPRTLDETYSRMLQDLESAEQLQNATKALRWLCFANRPFNLAEMVEILAIDSDSQGGFDPEERLPDPMDVMVVCSNLISFNLIDTGESLGNYSDQDEAVSFDFTGQSPNRIVVQLAHFSVKEFLLSDRCTFSAEFQSSVCHSFVAKSCLQYLLYVFKDDHVVDMLGHYPLLLHAAEHWWQHLQYITGLPDDSLLDLALQLLSEENGFCVSWVRLYNIDRPWRGYDRALKAHTLAQPLYYAAQIGVPALVQKVIQRTVNVNFRGGRYGSALQAAAMRGHEAVVKVLLDAGADVNAQLGVYGNTQTQLFQGLLRSNTWRRLSERARYGNALQAASGRGYQAIVKLLLDAWADVNAQGGQYGNALQVASVYGQEAVVKSLLNAGADVNAQGGQYGNALQAATLSGPEGVVRALLDAGADVNAKGGHYGNALQAASSHGREVVVKLLLAAGADVNAQGGWYESALQGACADGGVDLVQMLLDAGANINVQGGDYGNALQAASAKGHGAVVKKLLSLGADVNSPGGRYGSALQAASQGGHERVVRLLLDAGANVNVQAGRYGNALQAASVYGHMAIVQILVNIGANVNAQGGKYGNALQAASLGGFEAMVKLLLDAGADINAQGGRYGNAVCAASEKGQERVLRILLEAGADVNAQERPLRDALWTAKQRGYKTVVKMLLDAGVADQVLRQVDGSVPPAPSRDQRRAVG